MTSKGWVLAVGVLCSCAGFERGPEAPDAGAADAGPSVSDGGGEALSFSAAVQPVLTSSCARCHAAGAEAAASSLVLNGADAHDLAQVLPLVDLSNPAGSRLLLKAAGQSHGGGAVLTSGSAGYQTLLAWISSGANP